MRKHLKIATQVFSVILLIVTAGCQQQDTKTTTGQYKDTSQSVLEKNDQLNRYDSSQIVSGKNDQTDRYEARDSTEGVFKRGEYPDNPVDYALLKQAENILQIIKAKDYKTLSNFVHPDSGLFLSGNAYVDRSDNSKLSVAELRNPVTFSRKVSWGAFEPADTSFHTTIAGYFDKYVYDVDFINAEKKSINKFHTQGTDINNIKEAYPGTDVVEFFFPGFNPTYGGLDYRGLRLVFDMIDGKRYLMALVHDHWTP